MAKFFGNLNAVLVGGLAVLIVIMFGLHSAVLGESIYPNQLFRYLHVLCGIMWIGLLYYLNFVQVPTMPSMPDELKPAISGHIAPRVLFWFRWAAAFTVLTGLIVAHLSGYLVEALTFQPGVVLIGIGMWMALIMAFNVWFIIWPAQKKILGIVEASADEKAAAAPRALIASRTNTLLSIPMLYCMVTQNALGV
ncbi:MAG: urate hydroxylase PuuD [Parasphingopyxis sp.]|uniref:urate hydroxylase PuuD n=1 Tax=Parasphingopyxis sp. TaxID=1920299 RepID=UPI003F9FB833